MKENISKRNGAAFLLSNSSTLTCDGCKFMHNISLESSGVGLVYGGSQVTINNS